MSKLLKLRDYILLSAAMVGEVFDETRLVGGLLPSAMKEKYGFVPPNFKKASYLSSVSQMLSTKSIKKEVDEKGRVFLKLTSAGKKEFRRKFPVFSMQAKKWDGYFMIVIFDIPEKEQSMRRRLRTKLKELGFGMLQHSVWISPYHFEEDMREFLAEKSLESVAYVLSARKLWVKDAEKLAEKVWKLKEINEGYEKVVNKMESFIDTPEAERKGELKEIWEIYLSTLTRDPLLPKELLPSYWLQEKAFGVSDKLKFQ
ncbi:CRISPR-associated endonuclease Cas2 [Patescibacteria group bacterium]|nr:CRISPR-associated endonuclease Cas2 [Patescibacteria group bacterium]